MVTWPSEQGPPHRTVSPDPPDPSPSQRSSFIPSIISSIHHRPGYQRVISAQEGDTSYKGASSQEDDLGDGSAHGLRIAFPENEAIGLPFGASIQKAKSSPEVPGTAGFLLSPHSAHSMRRSYPDHSPRFDDRSPTYAGSSPPSLYSPYTADAESERLRRGRSSTLESYDPPEGPNDLVCKTRQHFHHGRGNWLSITILILSVYSTAFSGIWLGLAVVKPRYGNRIMTDGDLTPPTASLLFAAFAKTIELSFVTVFVAFLGQVLSRRSFVTGSRGISIAEMQMRAWIQQPGTLITHWETVRYAALTLLGALALTTTFIALLYTTASDALVSPKLKYGAEESKVLYGQVKTIFGNSTYRIENCKTPMTNDTDPWYYGQTCVQIEHSGQAYHNYAQYLTDWDDYNNAPNKSKIGRPLPVGMIYDNTTVHGSWIEETDMEAQSTVWNRIVNNVSLAMPLTAVFTAARQPINGILQPQSLDGLGEYHINASVPSPTVNVLCAEMLDEELDPIVYTRWPGINETWPNATNWPYGFDEQIPHRPDWLNTTVVDDLFGFGEQYGRRHPIFSKMPKKLNTVLNITDQGSDSIYILTTSEDNSHMLCSIRASNTPDCSTSYHASLSGGTLRSHCGSPTSGTHPNAYFHSDVTATSGITNQNWTLIANQWALTMSLAAGIIDGDASNARLLTQLQPTGPTLSPTYPSIAEALAVMVGCTIMDSGIGAPLIHYWNYSDPTTFPFTDGERFPQYQAFNATLKSQDYSSGGTQVWQGIFYVVLGGIFLLNVCCLCYYILHTGLVTDFIEPQNLFALAINSPSSRALDGACGGGPEGEQLGTRWHIDLKKDRDHFLIRSLDQPALPEANQTLRQRGKKKRDTGWEMTPIGTPVVEMYDRLSSRSASSLL